ncbi:MAG: hypothetical protein IPO21_19850 [Bacteroidales bacterium]|nr:hypothetical protein [Bacteroidales bacterium]
MEISGEDMDENILVKLQEFMKTNPENFTIIEEKIDIDLQMKYFKNSKLVKESSLVSNEIIDQADKLYDIEVTNEDKKILLNKLASLEDVEAYRIIEHFYKSNQNPLKEWTALALRESRMMLETSLLDEKQILISTGLGGKGNKLRYFIVLISKNDVFDSTQKKLIKSEFEFALNNTESEIESLDFDKNYGKMISLIPLKVSIKDTLLTAVNECNQYGNFLNENFIVTNVKEFTSDEIDEFIANKDKPSFHPLK